MHGVLAGIVADTDLDPAALKPSPLSAAVFALLAIATVLLLLSMLRHLRRAGANLGPATASPPAAGSTEAAESTAAADSSVGPTGPTSPTGPIETEPR